jgi:hypothetical protein
MAILFDLKAETAASRCYFGLVFSFGNLVWFGSWFIDCRAILLELEAEIVVWLGLWFWFHGLVWLMVY